MSHSHPSLIKIFVLGNDSLLDEGISNMLVAHPQLNVTRILYTDDNVLYDLVNFEHPYAIFINEFDELDIGRAIRLIFSAPSAFVRCAVVVHVDNSRLDVYDRPTTHAPVTMYQRKSIVIETKEEFINLAYEVSSYA